MKKWLMVSSIVLLVNACASPNTNYEYAQGVEIKELNSQQQYYVPATKTADAKQDNKAPKPQTTIKTIQTLVASETIEVVWIKNGSGAELLKVNQPFSKTWELLVPVLEDVNIRVKERNRALGIMEFRLKESYRTDEEDTWQGKTAKSYDVQLRLDTVNDGTLVSMLYDEELVLPKELNKRALSAINEKLK